MHKSKGGRPPAITSEVVRKLTEAFKLDMTVEEACTYAKISKDTYYRKCKADQGFSDEMERARQFATAKARRVVIEKMEDDGGLALKYLERKRKGEFSPRIEQDIETHSILAIVKAQEETETVDWDDASQHLLKLAEKSASVES